MCNLGFLKVHVLLFLSSPPKINILCDDIDGCCLNGRDVTNKIVKGGWRNIYTVVLKITK